MSFSGAWNRSGNTNRIFEMWENGEGMGFNQIVGVFRDEGMPITVAYVREVIRNDNIMTKKALPKKKVAKAKRDHKSQQDRSFNDGIISFSG